jgi:hypothetical protein
VNLKEILKEFFDEFQTPTWQKKLFEKVTDSQFMQTKMKIFG